MTGSEPCEKMPSLARILRRGRIGNTKKRKAGVDPCLESEANYHEQYLECTGLRGWVPGGLYQENSNPVQSETQCGAVDAELLTSHWNILIASCCTVSGPMNVRDEQKTKSKINL